MDHLLCHLTLQYHQIFLILKIMDHHLSLINLHDIHLDLNLNFLKLVFIHLFHHLDLVILNLLLIDHQE